MPDDFEDNPPAGQFTWYKTNTKNNSKIESISFDEKERIHYHGGAIFFLNLLSEDSGIYTVRHIHPSGDCNSLYLKVDVFNVTKRWSHVYMEINSPDVNMMVPCPGPVREICNTFRGNFTWYKDLSLLQGEHAADLWVENAIKDHEGIYTCICTWTHNHTVYNTSGSRWLKVKDQVAYREPLILAPTNKEQLADEGFGIKLNCSVFCGTNAKRDCNASWRINGVPFNGWKQGYSQSTYLTTENPSKNTISTAILTIDKVSAKDFQAEFKCICNTFYVMKNVTLTLKRGESIIPLVIRPVCVLLFCVIVAVLVKCFAIDLALFFRTFFPLSSHKKDARLYDAYVVYQTRCLDKVIEDTHCRFVTQTLPSVLEEQCGYQLFIHGRDDIPGEDHLELVEDSMRQSRRLIVILTPGSGSGSEITAMPQNSMELEGFDWQVGLHHALVQREMSVILIQLGDTGPHGYTHLPIGLQHLIRKSAPLRWPEGSRGAAAMNSRFWKRVRYLMPATPAKKCAQSAIV
ncbi:interleukin-1 receptor-like 1 [Lates japonicus]|uniref:Interleukin-1 receptor-like 1 n=1 Tax=Lates japonicus TaxID=270547 RepID=A0AAD3N1G1_LATJO|nr:interleukin-1 receptor-like 1 [Lates japonicus]